MSSIRLKQVAHPTMKGLRYIKKCKDNEPPVYGVCDTIVGGFKEIPARGLIAENNDTGTRVKITIASAIAAFEE